MSQWRSRDRRVDAVARRAPPSLTVERVLVVALAGVAIWVVGDVLLVVFAGLLLAIGLDGMAAALSRWTPIGRGWALAFVTTVLLGAIVVFFAVATPQVVGEAEELWQIILALLGGAFAWVEGAGLPVDGLIDGDTVPGRLFDLAGALAGRVAGFTLGAVGVVAGGVLVAAIAIFAAADPDLYRRGFLALFPADSRPRLDETLSAIGYTLRQWFLGQLISMLILGVTIGGGLWLFGIEQALTLGVLTAVLTFIPVIGPMIAGVPIVLVAFAQGVEIGLAVLVFYLVVQNLEGNFLVPLIIQRTAKTPPALLVAAQLLFTVLFGVPGLILGAPLTVAGMVAVQKLWVEGVAGPDGEGTV